MLESRDFDQKYFEMSRHEGAVALQERYGLKVGDKGRLTKLPGTIIAGQRDRLEEVIKNGGLASITWEIKRVSYVGSVLNVVLMPENEAHEDVLPGLPNVPMNGLTLTVRYNKNGQNFSGESPYEDAMTFFSKI